ncbi:MAG: DHHA1 domain-containing protein [Lachnospiraceae bacterium]|nr:DHHA1 domain-containing protein [Lachnospiraceae bacterium]
MFQTEKLFYQDAYIKEFTATVLDCREGKKGFEMVLSATTFYPEGGGQPYDTGILQSMEETAFTKEDPAAAELAEIGSETGIAATGLVGTGSINKEQAGMSVAAGSMLRSVHVLEVHEKNGELIHYTDAPLATGTTVHGKIDWARRFDLMQQHSGEHIVSGLVHTAYGYDNVGFHMGSDVITIDFNGELDMAALLEIEARANEVIWQNQETHIFYPSAEELKELPYRSKKELTGEVRIVEFPVKTPLISGTPGKSSPAAADIDITQLPYYADLCACCGLHVARAGEIGMVKLLSVVKFREGVRVEMISGKRVLDYLNLVNEQNHQISVLLSAKPAHTAEAVKRSMDENFRLKGRVMALEEKLFSEEAERLAGAGDVLLFEKDMDSEGVRKLAVAVMETCGGRCAVFSDNGDGTFKYAVGEKDGDLRAFVKEMNQALNGRGGGKPFFAQGSVKADAGAIRAFWEAILK